MWGGGNSQASGVRHHRLALVPLPLPLGLFIPLRSIYTERRNVWNLVSYPALRFIYIEGKRIRKQRNVYFRWVLMKFKALFTLNGNKDQKIFFALEFTCLVYKKVSIEKPQQFSSDFAFPFDCVNRAYHFYFSIRNISHWDDCHGLKKPGSEVPEGKKSCSSTQNSKNCRIFPIWKWNLFMKTSN